MSANMNVSLRSIFNAGRVMRWHTNAELAATNDRIDGHAGRVARLIAALHPSPSADILKAALTHDDGEIAVGDLPSTFKTSRPDIAIALAEIEADHRRTIWGDDPGLTDLDVLWLRFADRLDAFMWAMAHHADMTRDGWPEAHHWLVVTSYELGCSEAMKAWGRGE